MDFHFSSSHLSPSSDSTPSPPHTPPHLLRHCAPSPFSPAPLSWQKGRQYRKDREGDGRRRRGWGWVWGGMGPGGENHPSALCHTYDSRAIRPINEIIDHLMGLIINCFFTLSGRLSSSSPPHPPPAVPRFSTIHPSNRRST